MEEPSVLDYLKSLLTPWKGAPIEIPSIEAGEGPDKAVIEDIVHPAVSEQESQTVTGEMHAQNWEAHRLTPTFPWRSLFMLLFALAAQWAFAPPQRSTTIGLVFMLLANLFVVWAYLKEDLRAIPLPGAQSKNDPLTIRGVLFGIGIILALMAFLTSGGNLFSYVNLILLVSSVLILGRAFWLPSPEGNSWALKLAALASKRNWNLRLSRWTLLLLFAVSLALFFRFFRLDTVPPEMVSDHAEKFLDIRDILNGETHIFFPRNGGREALQFYLAAGLIKYLHAGFNFLTLKIVTALVGVASLPFFYLLGKEIGGQRVGFLAMTFSGIAYWTNVVSRAGMRLPFYLFFSAAILYFLLRGFRTSNRNDFIITGTLLGLGFYGYSANRILPFLVAAAVFLYLLHRGSTGLRRQVVWQAGVLALFSFIVFLPLLRYILQDPGGYSSRMLSRLGTINPTLPSAVLHVFLANLWKAVSMISLSDGVVWVVSIPDYPALEVVTGGLFYIGAVLIIIRYIRKRCWLDLFLIVSVPFLMLPSILSLAYPAENPNLYRTGGAVVPVFLLTGIALDSLMTRLEEKLGHPWGARFAWGTLAVLLVWASFSNYDLVFNKYYRQYRSSAQNTSEMGEVIGSFFQTVGQPGSAWVVAYPHWADTRLVAANAGYPFVDLALFIEELESTVEIPPPKLFLLHPYDQKSMQVLSQYYPHGWLHTYNSVVESKDFLIYFVPPEGDQPFEGFDPR